MNTRRSNAKRLIAAFLGAFAGVWGIAVTLIFVESQIRMAAWSTPISLFGVLGFVFLGSHFVLFATSALCGVRALLAKPLNTTWLKLLAAVSLFFTLVSLIPFSTVRFFMLPAALAALASSLLLLRNK